jgi:hypothetical protein
MRMSVNQGDPGYRAFKSLPKRVKPFVKVDGVTVPMVVTADDRRGYVLAVDADDKGVARLNARRNGVLMKQLRGAVSIELRRV